MRPPVVLKERAAVPDGTDGLTAATIHKLGEYARLGAADPVVRQWAREAVERFGGAPGLSDLKRIAWAVFWRVKHAVKFERDEPRLFRTGDAGALDLLIAPAVLVRMARPSEDCDGFSALIVAMLQALRDAGADVEPFFVTVAADPSDKARWSHVFALARSSTGEVVALDASHGRAPGWMVPAAHTFRWQAWAIDGTPADVARPSKQTLNGYTAKRPVLDRNTGDMLVFQARRRRALAGVGDWMTDAGAWGTADWGSDGGGGGGFDWSGLLNNLVTTAGKVASIAETPTQTIRMPNGTVISGPAPYGSPYGAQPSLFGSGVGGSSTLLWVGLGAAALFLLSRSK